MKHLHFTFALIMLACTNILAQVSGTAKLLGETNHEGIKVLFNAVSLTAKTDSTFTDVQGNYATSLSPGTYEVTFRKLGYYDSTYTEHIFVNGPVELRVTYLLSHDFVFVSGTAGGKWTKNKKYVLNGHIAINKSDSLVIEAGTHIYVYNEGPADYNYLYGTVLFEGSREDSIFIDNFFPNNPGYLTLYGIYNPGKIKMNYVKSNVYLWIDTEHSFTKSKKVDIITNSVFKGLLYYLSSNASIIKNNKSTHYAIFATKELVINTSEISCNHFKYKVNDSWINPAGVQVFTLFRTPPPQDSLYYIKTWTIQDNIFDFTEATDGLSFEIMDLAAGAGPSKFNLFNRVYYGDPESKIILRNNYFINYPADIKLYGDQLYIENNTFVNRQAQTIRVDWSSPKIKNNILGKINFVREENAPPVQYLQNNQISYNSSFTNLPGAGVPLTQNAQGADIDTYFNVIEDPEFSTVPLLKAGSPMIGAGFNGSNIGFEPKGTCLQWYFYNEEQPKDDTLSISGQVYANDVQKINATVTVINKKTGTEYATTTNDQGLFSLKSLPKGAYIVKAVLPKGSYLPTYFPKKVDIHEAETIELIAHITDMKILLIPILSSIVDAEVGTYTYPNPFSDELVIQNTKPSEITIFDVLGTPIYNKKSDDLKIDTSAWPRGIYMIKVGNSVKRFFKE